MKRKAHVTNSVVYEAETRLTNLTPALFETFLNLLERSKTNPIPGTQGRIPMTSDETLAY